MVGTAPRADVWVAVEHPSGWGEAPLARAGNGVRVVMARGPRTGGPEDAGAGGHPASGRVWVAYATGTPVLRVGTVDQPEEVAAWDLAAVAAGSLRDWGTVASDPLLLVCANGRRDRCCGHTGGRLADELWSGPHRDRVLTCTHLGGHRFAPTALLLPFGALHGRLDAPTAARLLADADAGRMHAVTLRGMSTLPEPAQVAEAHVRAATGYAGLAPLAVVVEPDGPDHLRARVRLPPRACAGAAADVGRRPVEPMAGTEVRHSSERPQLQMTVDLEAITTPELLACGRIPEPTRRWVVSN